MVTVQPSSNTCVHRTKDAPWNCCGTATEKITELEKQLEQLKQATNSKLEHMKNEINRLIKEKTDREERLLRLQNQLGEYMLGEVTGEVSCKTLQTEESQ